jgi:hypothetical protein
MKKLFKIRGFMYHISAVVLFALFFTASCMDEAVKAGDEDPAIDKAKYDLKIGDYHLEGENIESNWDPSLGIVWLGNDEENLPTGTLTILIDTMFTSGGRTHARIASAALSHVDHLTGTGPEINGKTYFSPEKDELPLFHVQGIDSVEVGEYFISGKLQTWGYSGDNSPGWQMKDAQTGEMHTLTGTFTAIVERP